MKKPMIQNAYQAIKNNHRSTGSSKSVIDHSNNAHSRYATLSVMFTSATQHLLAWAHSCSGCIVRSDAFSNTVLDNGFV